MGWLLAIAAVLLAFELWLRVHFGYLARSLYAEVPELRPRIVQPDGTGEPISVVTSDQITLAGSRWCRVAEPVGTIAFFPESGATRSTALHYAEPLIDAGYEVFAFDFRNTGESMTAPGYEPHHWTTDHEVRDADAIIQTLAGRAAHPLGVMGVSKGGGAAAIAAVDRESVEALCLVSAFDSHQVARTFGLRWAAMTVVPGWIDAILPTWHVAQTIRLGGAWEAFSRGVRYPSLEKALSRLRNRKILLISGARDNYIPMGLVDRLQAAANLSNDDVWLVPKAKHNGARDKAPEEYDRRVVGFFDNALRVRRGDVPSSTCGTAGRTAKPIADTATTT